MEKEDFDLEKEDFYDEIEDKNEQAYVDKDLEGIKEYKKYKEEGYVRKKKKGEFYKPEAKKKVWHPILKGVRKSELRTGIIFSEVLGKPKGLQ